MICENCSRVLVAEVHGMVEWDGPERGATHTVERCLANTATQLRASRLREKVLRDQLEGGDPNSRLTLRCLDVVDRACDLLDGMRDPTQMFGAKLVPAKRLEALVRARDAWVILDREVKEKEDEIPF